MKSSYDGGEVLKMVDKRMAFIQGDRMDHKTSPVNSDYQNKINAIFQIEPKIDILIEVEDIGSSIYSDQELIAARKFFNDQKHIPSSWQYFLKTGKNPPYLFKRTSFINLFSDDLIVLMDMYRPPWKTYFTSDVIFFQWLKSLNRPIDLFMLPLNFPTTICIYNITNLSTKYTLREVLDSHDENTLTLFTDAGLFWDKINRTPHLRCVHRILETYNALNRIRSARTYRITQIRIYRKTDTFHVKLKID